jgi:WS/DGAT/MGAT family acyltransferase
MDAAFLYMETPTGHMHVASTAVFDPSTTPGGWSFQKVIDLVESRLHLLPPFRWRLVEVPFGIHHPLWIEDPDFDIEYHIRRGALPSPGGARELAEFAADVISRPLDRTKPLWEMYVVEGLEGGHVASITKTHHAAIDGVSGSELTVNLLDLQAEPVEVAPPEKPWEPDRIPTDLERWGYALTSLSRQPRRLVKAVRRTAESALQLRRLNQEPDVEPPPAPFQAPNTSINVPITAHRAFAFVQVPLDDVKAVRRGLGGTVNDVVLTICSGAMRRYFERRGETVDDSLIAMVPISVRTEEQKGEMGNQVSSMLVSLASTIDDPVERLRSISASTARAKEQHNAIGADVLQDWAEFAAPALLARAARLYSRMKLADRHRPIFNLTISNVPGPPFPLYSAGARMLAMYPMGPIFDGTAVNITVMSYMGQMFFGVVVCREAVDDPWTITASIEEELESLKKVAAATAPPEAGQ